MANNEGVLEMPSGDIRKDSSNNASGNPRIRIAAQRLAIRFTDDTDLPVRHRKASSSTGPRRFKEDSELELRFKDNVRKWTQMIETVLSKVSTQQAWRFIDLSPELGPSVRQITDCEDFCDFTDYLIVRRDKDKCSADELGELALLSVAFQREIERRVGIANAGKKSEE